MASSSDLVRCDNFDGTQSYFVDREKIFFRPSVYALITQPASLLLIRLPNGQYVLPGGGIEKGERLEEALHREIHEEAGIEITIDHFFTVNESVIYFPKNDLAAHFHRFVFCCTPHSLELTNAFNIPEAIEHETPVWAPVHGLRRDDFYAKSHAEIAFDYLRHHQPAK